MTERTPEPAPERSRPPARVGRGISAADAWRCLGADPEYEPQRHDSPASGRILWKLNCARMLALIRPSEPFPSSDRPDDGDDDPPDSKQVHA